MIRFLALLLLHAPIAFVVLEGRAAPEAFVRGHHAERPLTRALIPFERTEGLPIGPEQRATYAPLRGTGPERLLSYGAGSHGGRCGLLQGGRVIPLEDCISFSGPPLASDGVRTYAVWERRGEVAVSVFVGGERIAERAWARPARGPTRDPIDAVELEGPLMRIRYGGDAVLEVDRHSLHPWPAAAQPLAHRFGDGWLLWALALLFGVVGCAALIAWRGSAPLDRMQHASARDRLVTSESATRAADAPEGSWIAEVAPAERSGAGAYRERMAGAIQWIEHGVPAVVRGRLHARARRALAGAMGLVIAAEVAVGVLL